MIRIGATELRKNAPTIAKHRDEHLASPLPAKRAMGRLQPIRNHAAAHTFGNVIYQWISREPPFRTYAAHQNTQSSSQVPAPA